jgi:flagellar motor switch protein FliM
VAEQILSQNEIDALLSAVNEGELELDDGIVEAEEELAPVVKYDLLSQDRIIRGRMPTLDIINDRFARQFRITLSNSLRKIVQVNVESTSLMKYGEFLNYLPIPSCLNLLKFHPLRGSCIMAFESKLIFAFLNNWFGGATNPQERIETRDFTAIELMIVKKVIALLLEDLHKAWQPVFAIEGEYIRTETNPQFLAVVAPSDVVVLTSFEIEIDGLRGSIQFVIPYNTIEPIRQHLSRGIGSDSDAEDNAWRSLISESLLDVNVNNSVVLGTSKVRIRQLLDLKPGDVLTLDRNQADVLDMFVEQAHKFNVNPMERAGHLAAKVKSSVAIRLPPKAEEVMKLSDMMDRDDED